MATQPAAASVDLRMQTSSFPYMAETWAQARAVYGPDGVVRDVMTGLYAEQDITILAAFPVYFGGIALNVENLTPASTAPNGIKVRLPGIKSFQLTGEALGYIPSPIPFSEAFTAVQTGVVDGVIGSGAEGYYASFRDVTKTYIPANTHFEVWYMIISDESLAVLNGEDLAAMSAKVRAEVWPQVLEDVGSEWGQAILDQVAAASAGFAAELGNATGYDLGLEQNGSYDLHFSEETLAATVAKYKILKEKLGGDYPFEVLGHNALRREEPTIGPKVVGAILHHQDGHANPLKLLRALADDVRRLGGKVLNGKQVIHVDKPDLFRISCADGTEVRARKLVLSAGLGAMSLGPMLGFKAPIRSQRGQVMITEKLPKLINRPSLIARQRDEGGIQIGATNKQVGLDNGITQPGLSGLAADAIAAFPDLEKAQLVRSWGALRITSPDGLPMYQERTDISGA